MERVGHITIRICGLRRERERSPQHPLKQKFMNGLGLCERKVFLISTGDPNGGLNRRFVFKIMKSRRKYRERTRFRFATYG
jgi:hypothetical protein